MTRDLEQIKKGLAQVRTALNLLETFLADYEARMVNVLPCEDVRLHRASDDGVIEGRGLGELTSLQQTIRETAKEMAST